MALGSVGIGLLTEFEEGIARLEQGLRACPESLWEASLWEVKRTDAWMWPPEGREPDPGRTEESIQVFSAIWMVAYHCLFYLDFYLTTGAGGFETPEYVRGGVEEDPINEHGAARLPDAPYTKDVLLRYLDYGRDRARKIIPALTEVEASSICPDWHPHAGKTLSELLQVNLAHIREHGDQILRFVKEAAGEA